MGGAGPRIEQGPGYGVIIYALAPPPFFSLKGEGIKLKINKGPPDIRDPIRGISSLLVELLGLKILRGNTTDSNTPPYR